VHDSAGQPIVGASVAIDGERGVVTDANGDFEIVIPNDIHMLRFSHPGFQSQLLHVTPRGLIIVNLQPVLAETMIVSGIRADAETPVTKTNIERDEIEKQYHGQDIPLLLRDAPSINAYTESGAGGSGYSYISLRGVSPTRINFTLDGVPLADSEDFGTYFADFPDLARSLQSIQIQRGVGTSTVGSPSFGGSVNLQSIDLTEGEHTEAAVGGGSYGGKFASAAYQRNNLYARFSLIESDGFRDNSGIRQHNLFISAAKPLGDALLKFTGFTGHENQQLAFYATDADTLKSDLRANPLTPADKDSFGYDLGNLQYIRALGNNADMTASVYYQRGYGWYDLSSYRYGLDGMLLGTLVTYSKTSGALKTQLGVHANRFKRDHTRDDYANYGVKNELNAFAKASYDRERWHLYGDAQIRSTDFRYHGDVHIDPIRWTFFNPKIGARYDISSRSSVYASAGMSTREPTRNDLFLGEDNASVAHDLNAVRPERLYDFETGWDYRNDRIALTANVYSMEFRNEIASTGELSDIGLLLRRNVDRSYRRGIELDAEWNATPTVRLHTIANVSRNRIHEWTQFYDVYDEAGAFIDSKPLRFRGVEPLLTPSVILNQAIDYTPSPRVSTGAVARWVGRSFLDNTNDADFVAPSFFTLDANVSVAVTQGMRVALQLNNALNNDRVYPSGYSYLFLTREASGAETPGGIPYYYPQATRNAMVTLDVKF